MPNKCRRSLRGATAQRRELIASLLVSVTYSLHSAAFGQQAPARRVGLLANLPDSPPSEAFRVALAELRNEVGRSIQIESRFFEGRFDRLPLLARELAELQPDVIAVIGAVEVRAVKKATEVIPVVFAVVPDPTAAGLVDSNTHPGGNLTGVTSFDPQQPGQQIALLKTALPQMERLSIIGDAAVPNTLFELNEAEAAALGMQPQPLKLAGTAPDIAAAFDRIKQQRADALLVLEHPSTAIHRRAIAQGALQSQLPTLFPPILLIRRGSVLSHMERVSQTQHAKWHRL